MQSEHKAPEHELAGEFFVEVIARDGLKHHVGPFQLRSDAREWIAQNSQSGQRKRSAKERTAALAGLRSI